MTVIQMWENVPALNGEAPVLEYYPAENKKSDAAVVIFPGGGYAHRAKHEGEGYALYLNSIGMDNRCGIDTIYIWILYCTFSDERMGRQYCSQQ